MDDFWKYLIVANNIAMLWMVFTIVKTNREIDLLKEFVIENAKADTQLFANTRFIINILKGRIKKLENPKQSVDVDVKDS